MKKSELRKIIKECIAEMGLPNPPFQRVDYDDSFKPGQYFAQWTDVPSKLPVTADSDFKGFKIGDKVRYKKVLGINQYVPAGKEGKIIDGYFKTADKGNFNIAILWDGDNHPTKYDGSVLRNVEKV
jgi:hypothetical protein